MSLRSPPGARAAQALAAACQTSALHRMTASVACVVQSIVEISAYQQPVRVDGARVDENGVVAEVDSLAFIGQVATQKQSAY